MPRRPKNQKISAADGTFKKHPDREKEIIPVDSERPSPPLIVREDPICLAIWDETVDCVESMGLICTQDRDLLTAYVLNYRQLLICVKDIQDNGDTAITRDGGIRASGAATNYARYYQLHLKMMSELGLTPAARASLAPPKQRGEDDDSAVADLLKRLSC